MEINSYEWYWLTDHREGDVWTPAYVRGDGTTMIDGKVYKTSGLINLLWRKAMMPEDEESLRAQLKEKDEALQELQTKLAEAERGLMAVSDLINESFGVVGLHLNGDIAPWGSLQTGGTFEEWLIDFDAAIAKGEE